VNPASSHPLSAYEAQLLPSLQPFSEWSHGFFTDSLELFLNFSVQIQRPPRRHEFLGKGVHCLEGVPESARLLWRKIRDPGFETSEVTCEFPCPARSDLPMDGVDDDLSFFSVHSFDSIPPSLYIRFFKEVIAGIPQKSAKI